MKKILYVLLFSIVFFTQHASSQETPVTPAKARALTGRLTSLTQRLTKSLQIFSKKLKGLYTTLGASRRQLHAISQQEQEANKAENAKSLLGKMVSVKSDDTKSDPQAKSDQEGNSGEAADK